jgi:16S rRNA (cytosine1402-N4)-methyltransferase
VTPPSTVRAPWRFDRGPPMTEFHHPDAPATGGDFSHEPVMLDEVLGVFAPVRDGVIVDATVGGGGHSRALLEASDGVNVVGLDRDQVALAAAAENLAPFGDRVTLRRTSFDQLGATVRELGHDEIAGFLFDLGVSSPQLDRADRGFSYRNEGPLDMRMDQSAGLTAADLVNTLAQDELAELLRRNGDERHAGRIAAAIVRARPITTTTALAEIVRDAIPAPARRRGGHPAKRTFQALRIEVNRELSQLPGAIDDAIALLRPKGRGAVLSYHSGEDRIVKERFRAAEDGGCTCPPRLPCVCGAVRTVRLLWRSGRRPGAAEIERNPRAESARLRAIEKLVAPVTDRAAS